MSLLEITISELGKTRKFFREVQTNRQPTSSARRKARYFSTVLRSTALFIVQAVGPSR